MLGARRGQGDRDSLICGKEHVWSGWGSNSISPPKVKTVYV